MAGRGPVGKDDDERVRRGPRAAGATERLVWDGVTRGDDLPEADPPWPHVTERWWLAWRNSAVAMRWVETDWQYALATAVIHASFWSGNSSQAAELRLREATMGATLNDRKRMAVDDATGRAPALSTTATSSSGRSRKATARKARVLKLVEDQPDDDSEAVGE